MAGKLAMTKQCARCNKIKPTSNFRFVSKAKRVYYSYCKPCCRLVLDAHIAKNPQKFKERAKARTAKYREAHPETSYKSSLATHLRKKFGLTLEEFEALAQKQNNVCAICGEFASSKSHPRLSVDHDHVTGLIRGLLCLGCNAGLGAFKDSTSLLTKAVEYLQEGT